VDRRQDKLNGEFTKLRIREFTNRVTEFPNPFAIRQ